jgi:hypothetical protein
VLTLGIAHFLRPTKFVDLDIRPRWRWPARPCGSGICECGFAVTPTGLPVVHHERVWGLALYFLATQGGPRRLRRRASRLKARRASLHVGRRGAGRGRGAA